MATVPATVGPPRGRPRSEHRSAAVLTATLEEIGERGIAGLTIEAVAARAGVSKVTVYRRWPDRVALVLAALESLPELPVPDTGDLVEDLRALRRHLLDVVERSNLAEVLPALLAERRRSDHGPAIRRYVERRSQAYVDVVDRARARGEVVTTLPTELVALMLSSPLALSLMNRDAPLTDEEWTTVVRTVLHGLGSADREGRA